ncbi:MAG: NUDIX domain-containing protein [bacterium]|jgi:8-oxo-dGTP diphosphatase
MINLRVYGILITKDDRILVSDEYIRGNFYTKFPGGGLEFGEGTRECLVREFMEELNLKIKVGDHIYTTDFFQMSAFNPEHQIISVYYRVHPIDEIRAPIREKAFDFDEEQMKVYHATGETETFRLIPIEDFGEDLVSLPIDKVVASLIKNHC